MLRVFFRSRYETALEILALRPQVAVLKRQPPRPRLNPWDRFFWTALRHVWSRWAEVLIIAKPETMVAWHRAGFRLFWRWRSRADGGRPKTTAEIRVLIRRIAERKSDLGSTQNPRRTPEVGIRRLGTNRCPLLSPSPTARSSGPTFGDSPDQSPRDYRDFFTVPTVTFELLLRLLVIEHERRKIPHFNVTRHPSAEFGDSATA